MMGMMVLAFRVGPVLTYVGVDEESWELFGRGPGTGGRFVSLSDMFTQREDVAKLAVVKKIVAGKKSLGEVKDYVVSEFEGQGFTFEGVVESGVL